MPEKPVLKSSIPKLTFKKDPRPTGPAAFGRLHANTKIKLDGREVGFISSPYMPIRRTWILQFAVVKDGFDDGYPNCPWMWLEAPKPFKTEPEAREWFKRSLPDLLNRYTFHKFKD